MVQVNPGAAQAVFAAQTKLTETTNGGLNPTEPSTPSTPVTTAPSSWDPNLDALQELMKQQVEHVNMLFKHVIESSASALAGDAGSSNRKSKGDSPLSPQHPNEINADTHISS